MAKVIGDLPIKVGEEQFTLHLGFRSIATLQDEFGRDLKPIMEAFEDGELPDFRAIVRIVEVSLTRYHPDAGPDVADAIMAENPTVFVDLISAAFPGAAAGDAKAAGSSPAKKRTRAA